jgi:hypothetical protein
MASLRRNPSAPAPAPPRRYQSAGYRAKKLLPGPTSWGRWGLAVRLQARPFESGYPTVVSQIAHQTSSGLTAVLGAMENVNVTIVPFHLAGQSQPRLHAVRGAG